jgi:hypothetical protein
MMDEKMAALIGAAAAVTVAGRGLRPVAKLAMKGVVAASEATSDARRGIVELYDEVKAEQRGQTDASSLGAAEADAAG